MYDYVCIVFVIPVNKIGLNMFELSCESCRCWGYAWIRALHLRASCRRVVRAKSVESVDGARLGASVMSYRGWYGPLNQEFWFSPFPFCFQPIHKDSQGKTHGVWLRFQAPGASRKPGLGWKRWTVATCWRWMWRPNHIKTRNNWLFATFFSEFVMLCRNFYLHHVSHQGPQVRLMLTNISWLGYMDTTWYNYTWWGS